MGQATRPQAAIEPGFLEDLLGDILHGDATALATLHEHTVARLSVAARAFSATWNDANEIVSGVYEQVWHRTASYDPASGSVSAWLCGIARQLAAQRNQSRRGQAEIDDESRLHS